MFTRYTLIKSTLLFVLFSTFTALTISAATYYSTAGGTQNLTTLSFWKPTRVGTGTSPTNFTSGDIFVVQGTGNGGTTPHLITSSTAWSISGTNSKLQIENGASITSTAAITLATASTFQIDNGGLYVHNNTTAASTSIFQGTESFGASSTVQIDKWVNNTTLLTTGVTLPYGNLTINNSSFSTAWNQTASGTLNLCAGNLTVTTTGGGELRFTSTGTTTINVAGNYSQAANIVSLASGNNAVVTLNVGGNFSMTNGSSFYVADNNAQINVVNVTGTTTLSNTGTAGIIMTTSGGNGSTSATFQTTDFTANGTSSRMVDFGSTGSGHEFRITGNFNKSGTGAFYTTSSSLLGSFVFNKAGTQTFTYSGTTSQYTNYIINSGSTLQMLSGLTLGTGTVPISSITINNGGTIDMGTQVITGGNNTDPKFTLNSGAKIITANATGVQGSVTNIGASDLTLSSGANYEFQGAATGTFTTSTANTVNNMIINRSGGVSQSMVFNVNGNLDFQSGILATNGNLLSIATTGSVINAGTGKFVNGNLTKKIAASTASKAFEVGDASVYAPVTIAFTGTTNGTGSMAVVTTSGDHASISTSGINSSASVNRKWTITNSSVTFTTYAPTFNFVAADIDGGANTANFRIRRFLSSTWNTSTTGTLTSTSSQCTGLTAAQTGDFQIGEQNSLTITCPSNINVNAGASCNAVVNFTGGNAATSTSTPAPTISYSPISGSTFSLGSTTVTATATNINGTATCNFNVVVSDVTNPTFTTCPSNASRNTGAGVCTYTSVGSEFNSVAADNCSVSTKTAVLTGVTSGSGLTSLTGVVFNKGVTNVVWTATDGSGNFTTCSFTVTVTDNQVPIFTTCPGNASRNADAGVCTYTSVGSEFNSVATDNCSVSTNTAVLTGVTTGSGLTSLTGVVFNKGVTNVVWTATDASGNSATCSFTVTVADNQNPIISNCPSNISINNDAGLCTAVATWTVPTAADNCGIQSFTSNHNSGDVFPVGTSSVTYTATDVNGNVATCSFNVVVSDNEVPTITCPATANIVTDNGLCSSTASIGSPTTSDNCGVQSTVASPSGPYAVGSTNVTWTVTDIHGNINTCVQVVNVSDNQNPVISNCPSNISLNNDAGLCSAVVAWTAPTAADNCGIQSFTSNHNSGDAFPIGTTVVTYTATDIHGNVSTCSFNVLVIDNELPVISNCPANISLNNDAGLCTAVATWTAPTAADNCGIQSFTSNHNSGDAFPVGTTVVTYTATDIHGNVSICSFNVIVADNELPVISNCPIDINLCGAQNVSWTAPTAADNCGIQSFTSNHNPGDAFSVGTTVVTYTATDIHGNVSTCSFNVILDNPATASAGSNTTVCFNTNSYQLNGSFGGGASSASWSTNGDGTFDNASLNNATYSFGTNDILNGSVVLTFTTNDPVGPCNAVSSSMTLSIDSVPIQPGGVTGPLTRCTGNTGIYSFTNPEIGVSYNWSEILSMATITNGQGSNTADILFNGTLPGGISFYQFTITPSNTCGTGPVKTLAVRNRISVPNFTAGPAYLCQNAGNVTYSASSTGADSYTWSVSGAGMNIIGPNNGSSVTINFNGTFTQGTINVTATNACMTTTARSMTVKNSVGQPTAVNGNNTACNSSVVNYTCPAVAGAASYQWTATNGGSIVGSPPYSNSVMVQFPASFTSVVVNVASVSSCGGTSALRSKSVTNGKPGVSAAISGQLNGVCSTIQNYSCASVAGATSYFWTVSGGSILNGQNSNAISVQWNGNSVSGSISVYASNTCGNGGLRTVSVRLIPDVPAEMSGDANVCPGDIETYTLNNTTLGATSYTWVVPAGSIIVNQSNEAATILWGNVSGNVVCTPSNACGNSNNKAKYVTVGVGCRTSNNSLYDELKMKVYPNPSHGVVFVELNSNSEEQRVITISDITGKVIFNSEYLLTKGMNRIELNLESFAKGIYFIKSGNSIQKISVE